MRSARRRQRGFSAIEAIAALAVLTVAAVPLLTLQGRLAQSAVSMQRQAATMTMERSALAYLSVVNPMRRPEGTLDLGAGRLAWSAVPVSEERFAYGQDGSPGRFVMRLYRLDGEIDTQDGHAARFAVERIGWRATAPLLDGAQVGRQG